eukprot:1586365-Prymnesium_polylepis.1
MAAPHLRVVQVGVEHDDRVGEHVGHLAVDDRRVQHSNSRAAVGGGPVRCERQEDAVDDLSLALPILGRWVPH